MADMSDQSPKTILVVEDEAATRQLICEALALSGYQCTEAADGYSGLKMLETSRPDLILMDINMPGMDGYEATIKIKSLEEVRDIPVVAFTGDVTESGRERCLAAGCDGFIKKPLDLSTFCDLIEAFLGGKRERLEACTETHFLREHNERLVSRLEGKVEELLRAQSKLKSYIGHLELALDMAQQMARQPDVEGMLGSFCRKLASHMRATYCAIGLLDGPDTLSLVGHYGQRPPWEPNRPASLEALPMLKWVVSSMEEAVLTRDTAGLGPAEMKLLFPEGTGAVLLVPLALKGEALGLFMLGEREASGAGFRREKREICRTLLAQAGTYLENTRLIEKTHNMFVDSIYALATALDERDPYTKNHSDKVTQYAMTIAFLLGLPLEEQREIKTAGMLHDIGKIGIPDAILLKPGGLTREEFDVIRSHPVRGARIIHNIETLRGIIPIVEHHHERWDGRGYAGGLAGKDIPLGARILAIADSYDAMTSDRTYRQKMPHEQALAELRRCAGSQFDPELVKVFIAAFQNEGSAAHQPPSQTSPVAAGFHTP
jgi:putative nucleotidyltransferase with HDIG domain